MTIVRGFLAAGLRLAPSLAGGQALELESVSLRIDHDLLGVRGTVVGENGHPPASLAPLAPRYARGGAALRGAGCRPLEYRAGGSSGRWELRLECPNGWMTLDQVFYRPGERYLPHEHDQRFGRWVCLRD